MPRTSSMPRASDVANAVKGALAAGFSLKDIREVVTMPGRKVRIITTSSQPESETDLDEELAKFEGNDGHS